MGDVLPVNTMIVHQFAGRKHMPILLGADGTLTCCLLSQLRHALLFQGQAVAFTAFNLYLYASEVRQQDVVDLVEQALACVR